MFTPLKRVYKAADVAGRWQVEPEELRERVQRGLRIYIFRETREDDDGTDIYYCDGPYNDIFVEIGDCTWKDIEGYLFDAKDIEAHQKANPYLLKPRKKNGSVSSAAYTGDIVPVHSGMVPLSANEVINLLKITPIELVDILNGVNIYDGYNNHVDTKRLVTVDEEGFRAHTYSEPYFTVESLKRVTIYQLDFDRYCEEWRIQEQDKPESADATEITTTTQLAEAQGQIESLRQWNKRLNEINTEKLAALEKKDARIAEFEKSLAAALAVPDSAPEDASPSPKTTAATEARATAELAKWKEQYAPAMVKVALRCGAEGEKKRQSSDFVKLFKDAGVTLSKKKLALFRGWLPDEHTDRDGGAPTQD